MASSSHSAREKPPVPLVSVSLSVPQQRQECAAWLQKQKLEPWLSELSGLSELSEHLSDFVGYLSV